MEKIRKRKKIIFLIIFSVIIIGICYKMYSNYVEKKLEYQHSLPYNFETVVLPEIDDFKDELTNYSKTNKETILHSEIDLKYDKKEEQVKLGESIYLETYGYKDDFTKVKYEDKFYFVKSEDLDNVSKGDNFKVIKGILVVNSKYKLSSDFNPGFSDFVLDQFNIMSVDANREGIDLALYKDFISYNDQKDLYKQAPDSNGNVNYAMYAYAGYNESQTGQSIDVIGKDESKNLTDSFKETAEYNWLIKNSYKYGFILRYPENKEDKTNFKFEPWHFRFVGVENAKYITENSITLEEFLKK